MTYHPVKLSIILSQGVPVKLTLKAVFLSASLKIKTGIFTGFHDPENDQMNWFDNQKRNHGDIK